MSTTPAKRHFRVGEGRTITLPIGLVEGASHTRVHAPGVECRPCTDAAAAGQTAPHVDVIELEHARIAGTRTGGQPFGRFIANLVRTGDLVELKDPPPAPASSGLLLTPTEPVVAHVAAAEPQPDFLSSADHARLAKETP